jgi:ATP-dependent protease HslVU (ClpYQ) peptidase subunit
MTCIVGLIDNGTVYIGGDSAGCSGFDLNIRADEKVFRNGPFVMGFTTSFRMGQLLRYKLEPPAHPYDIDGLLMDTRKYMSTIFIDAVRKCLKDGGYACKENEQETGGTFLVGYRGELFFIDSDYQVGKTIDNFNSVGCGNSIALGAMYATVGKGPKERIQIALEAAERYNAGVRRPFVVMSEG